MTQAPLRPPAPAGRAVAGSGTTSSASSPAGSAVGAAGAAAGATSVGRSRRDAGRLRDAGQLRDAGRLPWVVALVVYSAAVALVVGWPSPVDAGARDSLGSTLAALHARGVPLWVDYAFVERAANVVMFVPLGYLVTRLHCRWWFGLLVPAALSCAAELGQHLLRPDRYATWTDVAANTAGAALGMLAAMALRGRRREP